MPALYWGTLDNPICVTNAIRPAIIISKTVIEKLTDIELSAVFIHELTHIKRKHILLERIYDLARIFGIDEKNMRRYLSLSIDPQKTKIDFEGLRNKVIAAQNLSVHSQDPYTLSPIAYLQQKQNGMPVARADKLLLEKILGTFLIFLQKK